MVQIIPRPKSSRDDFAQAFANLSSSLSQDIPQELLGRRERANLGKLYNEDLMDIRNPDLLTDINKGLIQRQNQAEKLRGEYAADEENYGKIKNAFGEKFADIWRASPVGARTALTQSALEARSRGLDIENILSQGGRTQEIEESIEDISSPEMTSKFKFPKIQLPPHLTPAEKVKYQSENRKLNSPVFRENNKKLKALKGENDRLSILKKLNPSMPEGIEKIFKINPEGNIRPIFQLLGKVPPKVEQFAKTINDFLSSAKDMFGSRVTNYDIQAFKARLPTLINSKEGRAAIIDQMGILNEIERNYNEALDKVYSHYGLGKITEEEAHILANQMIQEREEELRKKLQSEIYGEEEGEEEKVSAKVDVIGPDGKLYEVDEEEIELLPQGYRLK